MTRPRTPDRESGDDAPPPPPGRRDDTEPLVPATLFSDAALTAMKRPESSASYIGVTRDY